ncbi:MAG: TetR/AcrR family transcriptional regulator [Methylacidiphilales bacterium]|nr:TetR/AcrR family transcriptional regulator [Candidatus Methylacidiphilales bacterium]
MRQESPTKTKLLETALELIWESSYGSVSVDDICTKAGVNKGSFYYAFKSKSDLAVAAMEHHGAQKRAIFDQVFSAQRPPLERLERYCRQVIEDQTEKFHKYGKVLGCPFCSLGYELSTQDENIRRKVEQTLGAVTRYLESMVRDLVSEGTVEAKDPKELARELYSYLMGAIMQAKIENNLSLLDHLLSGAVRLLNVKQAESAA